MGFYLLNLTSTRVGFYPLWFSHGGTSQRVSSLASSETFCREAPWRRSGALRQIGIGRVCEHRCPFWLIWLKNRSGDSWVTWWFNQLPGISIDFKPRRTPAVSPAKCLVHGRFFPPEFPRSVRGAPNFWKFLFCHHGCCSTSAGPNECFST